MFEVLASSDWAGLLLLLLLWMFIVRLAFWTLDRLFPRIERIPDDRAQLPERPDPVLASVAPPIAGWGEGGQERLSRFCQPTKYAQFPARYPCLIHQTGWLVTGALICG